MIELVDVHRVYQVGDSVVRALDGVTETVPDGDYVAIMGPSGSGKSTLLNMIGCLDRPSEGSYRIDGTDVGSLDEDALCAIRSDTIGFVFQTFHLVPRLSAAENVALPMLFAGVPAPERRERALAALQEVGLSQRADHRPSELSGGERQRVAIARATVLRPQVLLADEPTGNLDSSAGAQVMELLERLNREGLTLIVVTHDPAIASRARRALILRDGRIAQRLDQAAAAGVGAHARGAGGVRPAEPAA